MSRLLLDTNVLLWTSYSPSELTSTAREAIESANDLCFSLVSFWEIAIKFSRSGFRDLRVREDWHETLFEELQRHGFRKITLEVSHCSRVQALPYHHKDPFDRLLISQAIEERCSLVTSDVRFDDYDVKRIW